MCIRDRSKGEQGTQGLQGTQGSKGEQGTQGLQGLQGTEGEQGTQGLQGNVGEQVTARTYDITVNSNSKYEVDGVQQDTFEFIRGQKYVLDLDASNHPFYFQTTDNNGAYDSGNAYNTGQTVSGNRETGTITFIVPYDAPDTCLLYTSPSPRD